MKIIYYPIPKEDIDYSIDTNDIRNFTNDNMIRAYNEEYGLNCYIVQGEDKKYHLKVYLDEMREINFSCSLIMNRYNLPRIVYLGNEDYYYRKEIFNINAYEKLVEKYNDSREFKVYAISVSHKTYVTPESHNIPNTNYKIIEKKYYNNYSQYNSYHDFCVLMRDFLKKYHYDELYVKKTIRYYKTHMIHYRCDKCNKEDYEYNRNKESILFTTFYTSRTFDENDDKYYYKDKDEELIHTQGNTIDLCEDCFNDLPRSLPDAKKRLVVVKLLRHYNISDDIILSYFGEKIE